MSSRGRALRATSRKISGLRSQLSARWIPKLLALIATALMFAIEVARVTRQRSFGSALGTAVRRQLRAGLGAFDRLSRGGWDGGGDGGG